MLKAEVTDKMANVSFEGDLAQIGTDLTHMFHAIIDGIEKNLGPEDAHAFKLSFIIAFIDGLVYGDDIHEMNSLIKEALKIKQAMYKERSTDDILDNIRKIRKAVPKEVVDKLLDALKGE